MYGSKASADRAELIERKQSAAISLTISGWLSWDVLLAEDVIKDNWRRFV